jgi:hypothetical protein
MPPKKWSTLSIREDVRRALEEIALQKGFSSLNDVVAFLIDRYKEYTNVLAKLSELVERLSKLCTEPSVSTDKSVNRYTDESVNTEEAVNKRSEPTDKSVSSPTDTSVSSAGKQSNAIVKCFEKAKMKRPLESYIALFKSKDILVDWWEEGEDKVCFELKHSLISERNVYK